VAKDFDSEWAERRSVDARSFKFCGETFVMRKAIKPETMAIRDTITEDSPMEESMAALDDLFLSMIEHGEDAEARYRALRDADDELGIRDISDVLDWMIEQQTGRPPTSRGASMDGHSRTGTPSTAASSSRALTAA
jgi:hypothetical protein